MTWNMLYLCCALFFPDKTIRFNHAFGPKWLWDSNMGTHAYFAYFCSKQWKPPKVHYSEPQMVGEKSSLSSFYEMPKITFPQEKKSSNFRDAVFETSKTHKHWTSMYVFILWFDLICVPPYLHRTQGSSQQFKYPNKNMLLTPTVQYNK